MVKEACSNHTSIHLYVHQGRVGGLAGLLPARLGQLLGKPVTPKDDDTGASQVEIGQGKGIQEGAR